MSFQSPSLRRPFQLLAQVCCFSLVKDGATGSRVPLPAHRVPDQKRTSACRTVVPGRGDEYFAARAREGVAASVFPSIERCGS